MNVQSPFFAVIVFCIAFLSGFLLKKQHSIGYASGRYETIDGLRGFLAAGVFIHHAHIWQSYLQTGKWTEPASNLYNHLGQTSVAFFFMITSFLFISRLLHQENKPFNWHSFFLSRIFRIIPLYFFTVAATIFLVMAVSNWQVNTSLPDFLKGIVSWLLFTIVKTPINNSEFTFLVTGVTWSLPYEWLFYIALPLLSLLLFKQKPGVILLGTCTVLIAAFYLIHGIEPYYVLAFAGGAFAPVLLKFTSFKPRLEGTLGGLVIIICFLLLGQFHSANHLISLLLISIIFTLIASGNSLFGLLKNNTLKFLGEISYSTYLLHGMVLFATFFFGIGLEHAKNLTPFSYSSIIFAITPVLVLISFLSFRFIEKPFILKAQKIRLRSGQKAVVSASHTSLGSKEKLPVFGKNS